MEKFRRKSRVYVPMPTTSPSEIIRRKESEELISFLKRLKNKWIFP